MNITNSRAQTTRCWRKTFNLYHRNIEGVKTMPLVDGGAVHIAIAHGLATRDWNAALAAAKPKFEEEVTQTDLMQHEVEKIESHWNMVEAITNVFKTNFEEEPYEVVQPECMIDVPIPNSEHNCIWLHHVEYNPITNRWDEKWGVPSPQAILERRIHSAHPGSFERAVGMNGRLVLPEGGATQCPCYVPHRILGQTDALLLWEKNIWLHEVKTTAISGDQFWLQWELDLQPTIYLYGIWKQLGIQPRGMIYSALRKPTDKQVSNWNSKRKDGLEIPAYMRLDYERRAIPYTTEDILRVEWVLRDLCDEWEGRIVRGDFRPALMRGICNEYNRPCDFHLACHNHEEEGSFAGVVARRERYDDEMIAKQLVQIKEQLSARG